MQDKQRSYQPSRRDLAENNLLGKMPPNSPEAERAVLGAILLYDAGLSQISDFLNPEDFYAPAHQIVYKTMVEISRQTKRVDLVTLQDGLTKKDLLDTVGGLAYIVALQEDIPAAGLIEQHAHIIKENSGRRKLIGTLTTAIANCYTQDDKELDCVLDETERAISNITHQRTLGLGDGFQSTDIMMKKYFKELSDIRSGSKKNGLQTNYKRLDGYLEGLQPGEFIVLAARASMGKTWMALNITDNVALPDQENNEAKNIKKVALFSLEMKTKSIMDRLFAIRLNISPSIFKEATLTSDEWIKMTNEAEVIVESESLFINDDPINSNINQLIRSIKSVHKERGAELIIIDHLHLLVGSNNATNRNLALEDITRQLKLTAGELNIPIIALAQLNREPDGRVDKRPIISDLRDSGSIEQNADKIIFLYRDAKYNSDIEENARYTIEVNVAKNRDGQEGIVFFKHDPISWKITEIDESSQDESITGAPIKDTSSQQSIQGQPINHAQRYNPNFKTDF